MEEILALPNGITTVAGIQITSTNLLFLTVAGILVCNGWACVVSGAVAMLSKKLACPHPTAGTIYYWSVTAVFASATALSTVRWSEDYDLFVLGALAFSAAHVGRMARRRRRP